jgi:hypothetical protein
MFGCQRCRQHREITGRDLVVSGQRAMSLRWQRLQQAAMGVNGVGWSDGRVVQCRPR